MTTASPKRIVRIVTSLSISGKSIQAVLLTAQLEKLGYESLLLAGDTPNSKDNIHDLVAAYDVKVIVIPRFYFTNPLSVFRATWVLRRELKRLQPDIVHTHNSGAGFAGRIAARLAGVPVVVHTLHEYPFRGYYSRMQTIAFIYLERFGAYLSDSIITLSQSLREALTTTYNITSKSRITVLPIGYDLQSFVETKRKSGEFREAFNIPPDVPLLGIIGRIRPVKNHRLFLEAAIEILKEMPDARFAIIGDGATSERQRIERIVSELGLQEHVIFTGWQQQMERIYSDLDVLVNPSLNEGTPVPVIEALVALCPVVATDVGGVSDLLDNGQLGVLVPSGDCEQLVTSILNVLHNPPDMEEARATMLRRYSIERLGQDLDSLYRGLYTKKQTASGS